MDRYRISPAGRLDNYQGKERLPTGWFGINEKPEEMVIKIMKDDVLLAEGDVLHLWRYKCDNFDARLMREEYNYLVI